MDQTTEAVATEQQPVQTDEQTTTTLTSDTTTEQPKELDFLADVLTREIHLGKTVLHRRLGRVTRPYRFPQTFTMQPAVFRLRKLN